MNNDRNYIANPQTFIRTISIIHLALMAGQLLFAFLTFSMKKSTIVNLKPDGDVYFYIAPLLIFSGMLIGSFLFNQLLAKATEAESLNKKLAAYQSAFIIRCALSEGGAMFAIVCYLLTANFFYLSLAGVNILYFLWLRPTKEKIEADLNLSYEEKIEAGW